jgi:hypothetical protein
MQMHRLEDLMCQIHFDATVLVPSTCIDPIISEREMKEVVM